MAGERKKFTAFRRVNGSILYTRTDWKAYWDGLTENERKSLERKADAEARSLSAVAIEWGAIDDGR